MDLALSIEQKQLVETFRGLYAKNSSGDQIRQAEPLGFDPDLWAALVGNGILHMALPQTAGGWGASRLDLALVAEAHGAHVGSAPLVESQVAVQLLAEAGPAGAAVVERVLAADLAVTFALHPVKAGKASLVPYAAAAAGVVVLDGSRLLWIDQPTVIPAITTAALAVGDIALRGDEIVLVDGPPAVATFDRAIDCWMSLTAASLVGTGAAALTAAVAYTKERNAFDRPIGSFQAVAHRLADSAAELDGVRLLTYEAAWAHAAEPGLAPELSASAFATAAEAARNASSRSLHFHGGYGFMLEYDAQLFYRRARTLPALLAAPDAAFRWVSERRRRRQEGI